MDTDLRHVSPIKVIGQARPWCSGPLRGPVRNDTDQGRDGVSLSRERPAEVRRIQAVVATVGAKSS